MNDGVLLLVPGGVAISVLVVESLADVIILVSMGIVVPVVVVAVVVVVVGVIIVVVVCIVDDILDKDEFTTNIREKR